MRPESDPGLQPSPRPATHQPPNPLLLVAMTALALAIAVGVLVLTAF